MLLTGLKGPLFVHLCCVGLYLGEVFTAIQATCRVPLGLRSPQIHMLLMAEVSAYVSIGWPQLQGCVCGMRVGGSPEPSCVYAAPAVSVLSETQARCRMQGKLTVCIPV